MPPPSFRTDEEIHNNQHRWRSSSSCTLGCSSSSCANPGWAPRSPINSASVARWHSKKQILCAITSAANLYNLGARNSCILMSYYVMIEQFPRSMYTSNKITRCAIPGAKLGLLRPGWAKANPRKALKYGGLPSSQDTVGGRIVVFLRMPLRQLKCHLA